MNHESVVCGDHDNIYNRTRSNGMRLAPMRWKRRNTSTATKWKSKEKKDRLVLVFNKPKQWPTKPNLRKLKVE